MVKIIKSKTNIVVRTDVYSVNLSLIRGGTIRKLCFGKYNTGLKREGCEYWGKGVIHYEQEYGRITKLKIKENKTSTNIDVDVKMRMPKGNYGGDCTTKYIFKETKITAKSIIMPKGDMRCCDKYVCFNKNAFTGYYIGNKYYDMPKNIFKTEFDIDNIKLVKGNNSINIKSPNSFIRMYKTRGMIEVKPNFDSSNKSMQMEYCIEEETAKPQETIEEKQTTTAI